MKPVSGTGWHKGEFYEVLCLVVVGQCLWLIGEQLGAFEALTAFSAEKGLTSFIYLGFTMSFFLAIGSVRKSVQLRREMKARATAEQKAHRLARIDALTGLANRRRLVEALESAAQRSQRDETSALFLIDLDNFKVVNDAFGHDAGDFVLRETADRLKAAAPPDGVACRLGGDEFALLVPYVALDTLREQADVLIAAITAPIDFNGSRLGVGATIGIALLPDDETAPEGLLRCADLAMYRGKHDGRCTYRFFEPRMEEETRARASLESSLLAAIARGDIRPHYQPLVSMSDNVVRGFEVLARWYHPERGMLTPDVFIPIAEETGLISDLSYSLLRQACVDAQGWPASICLAINISQRQLKDPMLAERLLSILAHGRIDPSRLEVEVTESALMGDIEAARENLQTLQAAGVSIALDDFGTGYSSLSHLKDVNFNRIKIDRSFVQALGHSNESGKIVDAVLALGRSLGVRTTAEGIENASDSEWLAERGCTDGQGFLYGKPMPATLVDTRFNDSESWGQDAATPAGRKIPDTDIVFTGSPFRAA
jgi:diguanylate cyclase (GGDEF)-like protein